MSPTASVAPSTSVLQADPSLPAESGVSMIEVLVALLLVSFGILGLMRLQANSVANLSDTRYRTEAVMLANEIMSRIWIETDVDNLPDYVDGSPPAALPPDWMAKVNRLPGVVDAAGLPVNPPTVTVAGGNVVTVTIRWQAPSATRVSQHIVTTVIDKNGT